MSLLKIAQSNGQAEYSVALGWGSALLPAVCGSAESLSPDQNISKRYLCM